MSRYIATRAIRGANLIVAEAEVMLKEAIEELGADTPVTFPNTAYYLPVIFGFTGREVTKLGDLVPVIEEAKGPGDGPCHGRHGNRRPGHGTRCPNPHLSHRLAQSLPSLRADRLGGGDTRRMDSGERQASGPWPAA